jgi:glycine/D-amino acid oxidase-like deaminating enzyme
MPAPERVTVVIGAGVIGAAAALALRRSGRAVALLDAERVAAGASGWSGGVARVFHLDPEEARRAAYGFPVLRDLRRAIGIGAPFHETGYLYFPRPQDREAALAAARALASDHGTEFVGSGQLATLYPGLGLSGEGAIHEPRAGFADPRAVALAYAEAFVRAGGRLMEGVRVAALAPDAEGVRLETTSGAIAADQVVLAAGYATPAILDALGVAHDLYSRAIQVTLFEPPHPIVAPAFTDEEHDVYGKPDPASGALYVGAPTTAASRGEIAAEPVDAAHVVRTAAAARARFGWMEAARPRGGLRHTDCYSARGRGEVFRLPGALSRIVVAAGFSGGGFKMAPWAGDAAATLVAERAADAA